MQNPRPARESWDRNQEPAEEASGSGISYMVILLILLAVVVVCITGIFVARILLSDGQPVALPGLATGTSSFPTLAPGTSAGEPTSSSGLAQIQIEPLQGYVDTLINVSGQGWWPGEPVFVFLRSPAEAEGEGYAYAAAVADEDGSFRTAFTFPDEMRWMNQSWAEVLARGTRSQSQATTRFTLVVPTPTATVPLPTAPPTRPVTETPTPTSTGLATATPTPPVTITDWKGEYFSNQSLGGDPALIRNDTAIAFTWGAASPGSGIPADHFSARWSRQLSFVEGYYRFVLSADDGVRFWIDGQLVIDEWHDGILLDHAVTVFLSGGQHTLWLEYYENIGDAMVEFAWSQEAAPTKTPTPTWTPTSTPTSGPTSTPTSGPTNTSTPQPTAPPSAVLPASWQGQYFANPSLQEPLALQRQDEALNFDWEYGSPDPALPEDGFSARWTGELWLPAGDYVYLLMVDDGARLWIDGQLVLDLWVPGEAQRPYAGVHLEEGLHSFRVEYHEVDLRAFIRLQGQAINP